VSDTRTGFEDATDAELVSDLADRFLRAANAAGSAALTSPSSGLFVNVGRYRDFAARSVNITGSLLNELDPADLEAAAAMGGDDLVEEITARRDELERKRDEFAQQAMARGVTKAREDAAFAEAIAEQKETAARKEANAKAYQEVLAARQATDDLQRADVLERQAAALTRDAFDEGSDPITLTRKAKVLRAEAASLRGRR
jgi:hypothetical protein